MYSSPSTYLLGSHFLVRRYVYHLSLIAVMVFHLPEALAGGGHGVSLVCGVRSVLIFFTIILADVGNDTYYQLCESFTFRHWLEEIGKPKRSRWAGKVSWNRSEAMQILERQMLSKIRRSWYLTQIQEVDFPEELADFDARCWPDAPATILWCR